MEFKEHKAYVRRKKPKEEEHVDITSSLQGRLTEGVAPENGNVKFSAVDEGLVKLEQNAAEALAEFWQIANLPKRQSPQADFCSHLQWSGKRKRSRFVRKYVIPGLKEEPEDATFSEKKRKPLFALQRTSASSHGDESQSARTLHEAEKESPIFESRGHSPRSPLPYLQQSCSTFLVCGSPEAKAPCQKVVLLGPLQKPSLHPVKTEVQLEDLHSDSLALRPPKVPVRRKLKDTKSKAMVKLKSLCEQVQDALEDITTQPREVGEDGGSGELKKSNSALSEEEKEAQRRCRVQANRDSARQTIRRKQKLCEELSKKVASLMLENQGMKQRRQLLWQDLMSLKGQNCYLKQQLQAGSMVIECSELPLPGHSDLGAVQSSRLPAVTGVPCMWGLAVSQGPSPNQTRRQYAKECLDVTLGDPAMELKSARSVDISAQMLVNKPVEQSLSQPCNTPESMVLSASSITGPSDGAPESITTDDRRPLDSAVAMSAVGPPGMPASEVSTEAMCSSPQPIAIVHVASNSGLNTALCTGFSKQSMPCFTGLPRSPKSGYLFNGSTASMPIQGQVGTHMLMGRSYATTVAAEARRRRKELMQRKFPRIGTIRPPKGRR